MATTPIKKATDQTLMLSSAAWKSLLGARVVFALTLVLLHALVGYQTFGLNTNTFTLALTILYVVWAFALYWRSPPPHALRLFDAHWVVSVGVDLVVISLLWGFQAQNLQHEVLFFFPILVGAVLGSTMLALGTAAVVVVVMLGATLLMNPLNSPVVFQMGLLSVALMMLAVVVHEMSKRLLRVEVLNAQAQREAYLQSLFTQSVMTHLREGVLLVDAKRKVRASSPLAQELLTQTGIVVQPGKPFRVSHWPALAEVVQRALSTQTAQEDFLDLQTPSGQALRLFVRTHLTEKPADESDRSACIVFLQDVREQLKNQRNEKLASLGRLSSAVAHEIRNPLAAIVQANQLMAEDIKDPAHRKLSGMIATNAQRLSNTVQDILSITAGSHDTKKSNKLLALDVMVAPAVKDWLTTVKASKRCELRLQAPDQVVRFDDEHLHRVLTNLLDNALRYASEAKDAIQVSTHAQVAVKTSKDGRESVDSVHPLLVPQLMVWSDGAPLPPEIQAHLFEPFSSSESRSSGLGLYICQELCERHGARIAYQRLPNPGLGPARPGNAFIVYFASNLERDVATVTHTPYALPPSRSA